MLNSLLFSVFKLSRNNTQPENMRDMLEATVQVSVMKGEMASETVL